MMSVSALVLMLLAGVDAEPLPLDAGFGTGGVASIDLGPGDVAVDHLHLWNGALHASTRIANADGSAFVHHRVDASSSVDLGGAQGERERGCTASATALGDGTLRILAQTPSPFIFGAASGLRVTPVPADASFGTGGVLRLEGRSIYVPAMAVDRLGRMYFARGRRILRHTADGQLDASFGAGGELDLGRDHCAGTSDLVADAAGRIMVATGLCGPSAIEIIALAEDGSFDPAWGDGGVLRLTSPDGAFYGPSFVQLLPLRDGRLVVGYADVGLVRLHALLPDGRVDSGFGDRGVAAFRDNALLVGRIRLAEGATGRIAAGYPTQGGGRIAIFGPGGDLDTTVGANGVILAPGAHGGCGSLVHFPALAVEDNGGIAYARTPDGAASNTTVVRLDPRGRPRAGFGVDGELRFRGGDAPARSLRVFVDAASNAVVVGTSRERALLVGITSSGALDRRYGDDGIVRPAYPVRRGAPLATVDAVGRLLLYFAVDGDPFSLDALGAGVHRYLRDGRPDPSFGHASHALPPAAYPAPWFHTMLTDARSRIVLVGHAEPASQAVRFDADGTLDWTFGRASVADLSTGLATARMPRDGRLAVLRADGTNRPRRLDRYGESGELASSVELEGTSLAQPFGFERELVLLDAGGFALCTSELVESTPAHVWRRYRADGALDRAYGDGGVVRIEAAVSPNTITVDREGTCRFAESLGGRTRLSAVRVDGRPEPSWLVAFPATSDLALDPERRLWMTGGPFGRFTVARTIPLP